MTLLLQLIANGIYVGSIYALFGLSFAAIFATTKIWHFAQAAVYGGAALIVIVLAPQIGLVPAILIASAIAGAAGWLCQTCLYEPLGRRKASMLVIVIASLGLTIVVQNLLSIGFGPSQRTLQVDLGAPHIIGGVVISTVQIIAPAIAVAFVVAMMLALKKTRIGRSVQALIVNEELLTLQGIAVRPIRRGCLTLGSAMLPIPAALLMISGTGVSPYVGMPVVLIGAMALFLGGIDSLLGAAIGGFLIGFVENVILYFVSSSWQAAITYSLSFVVIMARPTGLFGRRLNQLSV